MKLLKTGFILIALILIVGYVLLYVYNRINQTNPAHIEPKKQNVLRIVTANIQYRNQENNPQTTSLLSGLDADVLIILEYTGSNLDLRQFENSGYKTILDKPIQRSPHGICAIIKENLEAEGLLIKTPFKSPCQMPFATIRVKMGNETVSVWGVHAPPPVPYCEFKTGPTIRDLSTYVSDGRLNKDLGVSRTGDLIVMAGDFNMFWFHPAFAQLKKSGLNDCFASSHFLPSTTWSLFPWIPKFVGLDYIFCSRQFQIINSYMIKVKGSDHNCIITDIDLVKNLSDASIK